jgi:BirA family transcriptional regulator, biotin operon repressor / biotin---[acetyl-CoA-carboxylase] ligase
VTPDARTWDDDLLRTALDESSRRATMAGPGWGPVAVLPSTGSTNADAADQAREGAPEGFTVVADEQTAGRGRLGRAWTSPPGAGLAMSVVLRPVVAERSWGWLTLLAGVAVVDALRGHDVDAALTWPNDVMVDGPAFDDSAGPRKLGGLLAEHVQDAVVLGIGLNVDLTLDELPVARATSTRLEGSTVRREVLLVSVLDRLRERYTNWQLAAGDAERCGLLADYAAFCLTLGSRVRATLPGDVVLEARAEAVDPDGRLVLRTEDGGVQRVSAGDVLLLR